MKEIKVAELFAGVGGFRIGFENASDRFKVVWSNQWEPNRKKQEASDIYVEKFGPKGHSNVDIAAVPVKDIPKHNLLVGGFPCQDYSVAKTLRQSSGIEGKKGVLWWEIKRILDDSKHTPEFILLENVDRLLKSPSTQRGRDFAIILASLADSGYIVEWRVVNAADYGMPQRRRRVFILGYHKSSALYKKIEKTGLEKWLTQKGTLINAFPVEKDFKIKESEIEGDLVQITKEFNKKGTLSPFETAGIMHKKKFLTFKSKAKYTGKQMTLGDVLIPEKDVPKEFYLKGDTEKWKYQKGAKKEERFNKKQNFHYHYAEGSMIFPDKLEKPSRTIVTGEGGSSASRFKHVIKKKGSKLRRLTPLELERLNMFPDNHTKREGVTDIKRAFIMGNALVTGVIERIGEALVKQVK
jgi:DNA (cytosine-5)-methyltransferase 1